MPGDERSVAEGRIEWTREHMPLLVETSDEFSAQRPFDGLTIGFRLHIEPKTAVLIEALQLDESPVKTSRLCF